MSLQHPLVVATFAAALGFGAAEVSAWMKTPTDVAVVAAEVRALQNDVIRLTEAVERLNDRIDAILLFPPSPR